MITFQISRDLEAVAEITLENMSLYYEKYSIEWDKSDVLKMTTDLLNYDILLDGYLVGVMRLSFDSEGCSLRDLQVNKRFQKQGIGFKAITEIERLAKKESSNVLRLKVFKCSPAIALYKRCGFGINNNDERFYYMERTIS